MMTSSRFVPKFGIIVEHPGMRGLIFLVLGPSGSDRGMAQAVVVKDDSRSGTSLGAIERISTAGWIILEDPAAGEYP